MLLGANITTHTLLKGRQKQSIKTIVTGGRSGSNGVNVDNKNTKLCYLREKIFVKKE